MATARDVAAAIRDHCGTDPGVTKVHKLLYYSQAWHCVWTGEPLFSDTIEAWNNGPVVADLWREEKRASMTPDPLPLADVERRTVVYVVARYGDRYGTQLVGDTHQEDPWQNAKDQYQNAPITLESLEAFFSMDSAADQAWYWDTEWQAGMAEAEAELEGDHTTISESPDEFVDALKSLRADL